MRSRDVPAPDGHELRACGLAALAEAGIVYLPATIALSPERGDALDIRALAAPFVVAYVIGALLVCRFRSWPSLTSAAVGVAIVSGLAGGGGDLERTVIVVVLALLVGFRVVTLGLRDWREPLHAEIGWFALALGIESILGSSMAGWRPLLVVFIPTFFAAALASRATTVWAVEGAHELDETVRASWIRRALLVMLSLVAAMALAVALTVRGGAIDVVARAIGPVANGLATFVGWALGQVARPVFWLVDRLGIDPQAVREFLERLREGGLGERARESMGRPDPALWQRLLGLLVLVLIGWAIVRVIRRLRPDLGAEPEDDVLAAVPAAPLPEAPTPPGPSWFRRELPADAIRRRYAEVLIALGRRRITKGVAVTPHEFAPVVGEAYPRCRDDFAALTRAYEDVRYGGRRLRRDDLRALEGLARHVLRTIMHTPPATSQGDRSDDDQ